ncbi:MAG: ATP-binding cassette domain-containing protein [Clostridiales Family XIII bacterium]|jgi:energy-coupling factor transport system ATP-binding protein|nr:ATP-binding cassette domain-containing protein [Clostridiales Family XIII bacterium]
MSVGVNTAIEVRDYTFRYPDSEEIVLDHCQFTLRYGEFVLLTGDSGSGKSTLIAAIIGSLTHADDDVQARPTDTQAGKIFIDGLDVTGESVSQRARLVSAVLQDADSQIVHTSVEDEIAFGCENLGMEPEEIGERVGRACALFGLERTWRTSALSGGQKQRLITAAALAMDRRILILDEPLANLDQAGAAALLRTLAGLAKDGYAILLAEHRIDAAAPYTDRIVRLDNERVHDNGSRIGVRDDRGQVRDDRGQARADRGQARADNDNAPLLSARGIGLTLGGRDIFRDISLEILRGERIVITGDNGSGKTMLLRTLARLQKPSCGEIVFACGVLRQYRRPSPAWFRSVGYVFQNPNVQLFMPSVLEEIAYGAKDADTARHYMELFGLSHLAERHPHSLSEGQKRLLTVAAVAAQEPQLLLLDEPTVGQDHAALQRLMDVLGGLNRDRTLSMIMVTHDQRCSGFAADQKIII